MYDMYSSIWKALTETFLNLSAFSSFGAPYLLTSSSTVFSSDFIQSTMHYCLGGFKRSTRHPIWYYCTIQGAPPSKLGPRSCMGTL